MMTEWTRQKIEEEERIFENPQKELRTCFITRERFNKVSKENREILKEINICNRYVANVQTDIQYTDDKTINAFENALLEMFLYDS
jgi:CMP-2-keto-3-deoxyoctulosonic acid synthetase